MGIAIFKIFFWGSIALDIRLEINFRPYYRQYISPNENFEYSYPLNSLQTNFIMETNTMSPDLTAPKGVV